MIDRSGQQLDNYRLLKLLGRGSFGEVYLAEHVVRKTQVAIKIFHIDSNQVNQPDMLEEISNLVRLNGHPNIIRIAGFSVKPPAPFIVMDYAPNGTLAGRHPRGMPVPLATVMAYVKQIASALQYAHEENLIHRDVKPANILIAQNGTLLLSDFGITIPSHSIHARCS
jgi:serine/threonine protein kinase